MDSDEPTYHPPRPAVTGPDPDRLGADLFSVVTVWLRALGRPQPRLVRRPAHRADRRHPAQLRPAADDADGIGGDGSMRQLEAGHPAVDGEQSAGRRRGER